MYEYANWKQGRAVWFLGIHNSNLLRSLSWYLAPYCSTLVKDWHRYPLCSNLLSLWQLHCFFYCSTLVQGRHSFLLCSILLSVWKLYRFYSVFCICSLSVGSYWVVQFGIFSVARWAFLWVPASEEAKYLSVGNCPLILLVPPDSVECGGPNCNWLRQTQPKSLFKNLLNGYRQVLLLIW